MYIDDEIKTILQNSLPANNNSPKKGNSHFKKKIKPYFITPLILSTLLYSVSFVFEKNKSTSPLLQNISSTHQNTPFITVKQGNEIKKIVGLIALYEKKHPNTVHNELKRLFGYHSYKTISYDTYLKVMPHLKKRLDKSER